MAAAPRTSRLENETGLGFASRCTAALILRVIARTRPFGDDAEPVALFLAPVLP